MQALEFSVAWRQTSKQLMQRDRECSARKALVFDVGQAPGRAPEGMTQ